MHQPSCNIAVTLPCAQIHAKFQKAPSQEKTLKFAKFKFSRELFRLYVLHGLKFNENFIENFAIRAWFKPENGDSIFFRSLCLTHQYTRRQFLFDKLVVCMCVCVCVLLKDSNCLRMNRGMVKCTAVQGLRYCTGCMAHSGSRGIAVLYRH